MRHADGSDDLLHALREAVNDCLYVLGPNGRAQLPEGLGEPYVDEPIRAVTIRHLGPWRVSLTSMMFNTRVLLTSEAQYPNTWTAGYCYDPGPGPILAALAWNPLTQARPSGYKKIAAEDAVTFLRENAAWAQRHGQQA